MEESGAEYSYCNSAFGQLIGFLIGWTNIILCKPARYFDTSHMTIDFFINIYFSLSVIVVAFAEYTSAPFYPGCDAPELLKKFLAITALLFISIVNGLSVKVSISYTVYCITYSFWISISNFHFRPRKGCKSSSQ